MLSQKRPPQSSSNATGHLNVESNSNKQGSAEQGDPSTHLITALRQYCAHHESQLAHGALRVVGNSSSCVCDTNNFYSDYVASMGSSNSTLPLKCCIHQLVDLCSEEEIKRYPTRKISTVPTLCRTVSLLLQGELRKELAAHKEVAQSNALRFIPLLLDANLSEIQNFFARSSSHVNDSITEEARRKRRAEARLSDAAKPSLMLLHAQFLHQTIGLPGGPSTKDVQDFFTKKMLVSALSDVEGVWSRPALLKALLLYGKIAATTGSQSPPSTQVFEDFLLANRRTIEFQLNDSSAIESLKKEVEQYATHRVNRRKRENEHDSVIIRQKQQKAVVPLTSLHSFPKEGEGIVPASSRSEDANDGTRTGRLRRAARYLLDLMTRLLHIVKDQQSRVSKRTAASLILFTCVCVLLWALNRSSAVQRISAQIKRLLSGFGQGGRREVLQPPVRRAAIQDGAPTATPSLRRSPATAGPRQVIQL